MRIERNYRRLDDIEEISLYNVYEEDLYVEVERDFELRDLPYNELIKHIPIDLDIFIPYNDGEDFIVRHMGYSAITRGKFDQNDVTGRLLSKVSPVYHELLYESLLSVYKTGKLKRLRLYYYHNDRLAGLSNLSIIYEYDRVFLISEHKDMYEANLYSNESDDLEEDKANLFEYFSQKGSYYRIGGKYSWTQGIYNILNRYREENDEFYNIVFDAVIPEDKHKIEGIIDIIDSGEPSAEAIVRIRTPEGSLKALKINLAASYDSGGNLMSIYGLVKDVSRDSNRNLVRPVDFLLNGFKGSKKIALLIEPLNRVNFEFSQGFYDIIGVDANEYEHNISVIDNIVEEETKSNIMKLLNNEVMKLSESFTYNVGGNPNNQKICELYIEIFEYSSEIHSIGFLTDVTSEHNKQNELREAYQHQKVLIKEVHHRVKNNLQVLNSFLNLERRAYKDQPDIIIDHMQSRLSSLAILHEKTYNTEDFKNINLKSYIEDQDAQLRNLVGMRDGIEFESHIVEDLNLTIEVITPLLLVIDELTMNAIKHAFPDKSRPNKLIYKEIKMIDDCHAELIFKDNGVGMDSSKMKKNNLGCEIIKSLTKQLDGHVKLVDCAVGIEYRLIFPIHMEHTILG